MSLSWLKSFTSYISGQPAPDDALQIDIDDKSIPQETKSNNLPSPKSKSESKHKQTESSSSIQGLENLGNTCFFNASVQALLSCPKFVEFITVLSKKQEENIKHSELIFTPYQPPTPTGTPRPSQNDDHYDNNNNAKIVCQYLLDLYEGTITSPRELFGILCAFHPREFDQFTQSDAHESFNKLMEILEIEQVYISTESQSDNIIHDMFDFLGDDDAEGEDGEGYGHHNDDEKKEYSVFDDDINITNIKNPFNGLFGSSLECTACKYENESRQTSFTCLTLSLMDELENMRMRANGSFSALHSIQTLYLDDRIKAFEIEEEIDGYRCMVCEYKGILDEIRSTLSVK